MRTKKPKTAPLAPVVDKSRLIQLDSPQGETEEQAIAKMMVRGTVGNASTIVEYSRTRHPELSLTDIALALRDQGEAVNGGDLASLERMLNGQAVALNAMFTELARRGAMNMGANLETADRLIRLALKAQSQSRATVETLAVIKNPPVVFARQANINNGGQQQVNNGTAPQSAEDSRPRAFSGAPAPAGIPESPRSELLEASDGKRLDTGAASSTGGADPHLEAVAAGHRAAYP